MGIHSIPDNVNKAVTPLAFTAFNNSGVGYYPPNNHDKGGATKE